METWRDNLQNTLNLKKIYPYQEWNKALYDWCKEYAIEIIRYDGMDASPIMWSKPARGMVQLVITFNNIQPFIIYFQYSSSSDSYIPVLNISFTEKFDHNKRFAKRLKNNFTDEDEDGEDYYKWIEDSIHFNDEPYALDKGFVLEYITIQFNKYLKLMRREK